MGRLAELEHDVVGGVDDRVDRPHPGQGQPAHDECRRGHVGDSREHFGDEPVAQLGRQHLYGGVRAGRLGALLDDGFGQLEGQAEAGGDVAGDAGDAQAVRPVALDGEVEHDVRLVGGPEVVGEREPELEPGPGHRLGIGGTVVAENQDARLVLRQAQLAARAQHPVGGDAPHPALLDAELARQHGADRCEGDNVAHGEVPGPANHLDWFRASRVDHDAPDLVRLRDRRDLQHPGQHDVAQAFADVFDALHDQAESVEVGRERGHLRPVGGPGLKRGQFPQPRQWNAHFLVSSKLVRSGFAVPWRLCPRAT